MSRIAIAIIRPPIMPSALAKSTSSGSMANSAEMRGMTRKSTGDTPRVCNASISSLAFMLPSVAANAAPVRPASTIAVINGPISRTIAMPTMSATKMSAPNCRSCAAAW